MRGLIKTVRHALEFVRDLRGKIFLAQALMLLGTGLGLLPPLLLGAIFDSRGPLTHTLGLLALTGVGAAGVGYGKNVLLGMISNRVALRLRTQVYRKLQRLPQAYYVRHHGGEIVSTLLNDIKLFTEALSTGVVYVVEMLVSLIAVVTLLLRLDAVLSLALLGMLLPALAIAKRVGKPVSGRSAEAQASLSEITDVLAQSLAGMDVIKAYALQKHSAALFEGANRRWLGHALGLTRMKARAGMLVNILSSLAVVGIVGLGAYRVDLGFLTLGALTSFILYAQGLVGPLSSASNLYMDVRAALAAMDRVCGLLDAPEEAGGSAALPAPSRGLIELAGVRFAYAADQPPVLEDLSLRIEPGQHAALVGASGAGKTTLLSLLLGFFEPTEGRILLDGQDIALLRLDELRAQTAVVSQTPHLFDLTIRDNIRCGRPEADDSQVEAAARLANAHAFITGLPNGYDTMAGEKGAALSGGQRQRIALARAFLKDAPILLLDEATSALDNASERAVKDAVRRLMAGRTTLTVAHRLTTIVDADVIFFLQDGRVAAQGTHAELMERCPAYAALCHAGTWAAREEG